MQVPRFSPRISLIEMDFFNRNGCPGRLALPCPALPCPYPALFVTTDRQSS